MKTRIPQSIVLALAATLLSGCTTLVKSMYDSDHPLGSQHNAVVLYILDTPKLHNDLKQSLGESFMNEVPANKVIAKTFDRYNGWTYKSGIYGWSDPGQIEVGDIVSLRNRGANVPTPIDAVVTKWND